MASAMTARPSAEWRFDMKAAFETLHFRIEEARCLDSHVIADHGRGDPSDDHRWEPSRTIIARCAILWNRSLCFREDGRLGGNNHRSLSAILRSRSVWPSSKPKGECLDTLGHINDLGEERRKADVGLERALLEAPLPDEAFVLLWRYLAAPIAVREISLNFTVSAFRGQGDRLHDEFGDAVTLFLPAGEHREAHFAYCSVELPGYRRVEAGA